MFNIIISLIVALLAGSESSPNSHANAAAMQAQAQPAATVKRVHEVEQSGDAPSAEEIQEIVIAELASLEGIDETIAAAVRTAMQEIETVKPAIRSAMASLGNQNIWRMRQEPVEFDENAAFFGVGTEPISLQTAAQLPITAGTGLIVTNVVEGSPAATVGLQPLDVLARLNDQLLVNGDQLAVLLRSHKPGDEVSITYLRGGKESTAKVKLDSRRLPKLKPGGSRADGGFFDASGDVIMVEPDNAGKGLAINRYMNALGQSRQPRMLHTAPSGGSNTFTWSTIGDDDEAGGALDAVDIESLNEVNMNYTTDNVAIIYSCSDGEVHMSVKDAKTNAVLFDEGRLPTKDELAAMPADARTDVERMLKDTQSPKAKIRRHAPSRAGAPGRASAPPMPPKAPHSPTGSTPPAPAAAPLPPVPPAPPAAPTPEVGADPASQIM